MTKQLEYISACCNAPVISQGFDMSGEEDFSCSNCARASCGTILKTQSCHTKAKEEMLEITGKFYCDWLHSGWGNRIDIDWETRKDIETGMDVRANGHYRGVKEGDCILSRMQSGKIMKFIVMKIEYMSDPRDMFFADLHAWEYYDGDQAAAERAENGERQKSSGKFTFLP